jgi:hypothetical protein
MKNIIATLIFLYIFIMTTLDCKSQYVPFHTTIRNIDKVLYLNIEDINSFNSSVRYIENLNTFNVNYLHFDTSLEIQSLDSLFSFKNIIYNNRLKEESTTFFLQYILKGQISLLINKEKDFFISYGDTLIKLENTVENVDNILTYKKEYISQLRTVIFSSSEALEILNNCSFNLINLKNLLSFYCKERGYEYQLFDRRIKLPKEYKLSSKGVDFYPGIVKMANNDTVFGLIADEIDIDIASAVKFKQSDETDDYCIILPSQIYEVNFENRKFISRKIEAPNNENGNILLKVVSSGKISLFALHGESSSSNRYFIEKDSLQRFIELKQVITIEDNKKFTDNKYKQTLTQYMYDKFELHQQIEKCRFNEPNISSIIDLYNGNYESENIEKKHLNKTYGLSVTGPFNHYSLGGFIKFDNQQISKRSELIISLEYRYYRNPTLLVNYPLNIVNAIEFSKLKHYELNFIDCHAAINRITIRYKLFKKNFSPFIDFGLANLYIYINEHDIYPDNNYKNPIFVTTFWNQLGLQYHHDKFGDFELYLLGKNMINFGYRYYF